MTTDSMRRYSFACLKWARTARDASAGQHLPAEAREWFKRAELIDNGIAEPRYEVADDLENKLH
jgi:hypothetical protein